MMRGRKKRRNEEKEREREREKERKRKKEAKGRERNFTGLISWRPPGWGELPSPICERAGRPSAQITARVTSP